MKILTSVIFSGLIILALAMLLARQWWMFDVLAIYIPIFTVAASIVVIVLLFQKRFLQALFLIILTGYLSWPLVALSIPAQKLSASRDATEVRELRVMQANVYYRNTRYDDLAREIKIHEPDIIAMQEVTQEWIDETIRRTGNMYRYAVTLPQDDYRGIAVLSKLPIVSFDEEILTAVDSPILRVTFQDEPFVLYVAHTLPPIGEALTNIRDNLIRVLASAVASEQGPVIITGDLNSASQSPIFRDLLKTGQVQDARAGYGWEPTWMRSKILAAAIDHVLYRGTDFQVKDFQVLEDFGSDHRPLMITFAINESGDE